MGTFTLTTKAKADLKSIAIYTQRKWGKEQRRIYIRQFDDTFHMLSENPKAGTECDYIKNDYRKFRKRLAKSTSYKFIERESLHAKAIMHSGSLHPEVHLAS
jgi:toxin ParE1/3/4